MGSILAQIWEIISSSGFNWTAGLLIGGLILNFILKKFLTQEKMEQWGLIVHGFFRKLGIICTVGLTKWLKGIWNKIIEPYVIILLQLIIGNAVAGFIEGLQTDNDSYKKN